LIPHHQEASLASLDLAKTNISNCQAPKKRKDEQKYQISGCLVFPSSSESEYRLIQIHAAKDDIDHPSNQGASPY